MTERKTIVFDGVCVLCNRWVQFVLARDARREFSFAAMQGQNGRALLQRYGIDPDDPVTFLLLDGGKAYTDTDAALRVIERFGLFWRCFARVCHLIPSGLRNWLYRLIARNRYRLFGRRGSCVVPAAADAHRFLP
jgi:predicted DCC family thiol-disulfide oxidoreductase YuxK